MFFRNEDRLYPYPSTPLVYTISKGNIRIVRLLVENGANVNAKANNGGIPLNVAIHQGDTAIVSYLLEKGAGVSLQKSMVQPYNP